MCVDRATAIRLDVSSSALQKVAHLLKTVSRLSPPWKLDLLEESDVVHCVTVESAQ